MPCYRAIGNNTGMQRILKVLVRQVPHHTQRPSNLLGPFVLTLGKTFPDPFHCVDKDNVAVGYALEIKY